MGAVMNNSSVKTAHKTYEFSFCNRNLFSSAERFDFMNKLDDNGSCLAVPDSAKLRKSYRYFSTRGMLVGFFLGVSVAAFIVAAIATTVFSLQFVQSGVLPLLKHITVYNPLIWMSAATVVTLISLVIGLTMYWNHSKSVSHSFVHQFFFKNNIFKLSITSLQILATSLFVTFIILKFIHFQSKAFIHTIGNFSHNNPMIYIGVFITLSVLTLFVNLCSAYRREKTFHEKLATTTCIYNAINQHQKSLSMSTIDDEVIFHCQRVQPLISRVLSDGADDYQIDGITNWVKEIQAPVLWTQITSFLLCRHNYKLYECENVHNLLNSVVKELNTNSDTCVTDKIKHIQDLLNLILSTQEN